HVRSSALYASMLGFPSIMVMHDIEPKRYTGNLLLTKLSGTELRYVEKTKVKEAMDKAIQDLKDRGYNPLYIWGGGHCVEGSLAYYKAVFELKKQLSNIEPDYIILPSGTGTTQAGIEVGVRHCFSDCMVLGISVARNQQKG